MVAPSSVLSLALSSWSRDHCQGLKNMKYGRTIQISLSSHVTKFVMTYTFVLDGDHC